MTLQRMKMLKDELKKNYEQKLELLTIAQNNNASQNVIIDLQTQVEYLRMEYIDIHLSHVAQFVRHGFFGKLDVALIEVAGITEEGFLIPSSSVNISPPVKIAMS